MKYKPWPKRDPLKNYFQLPKTDLPGFSKDVQKSNGAWPGEHEKWSWHPWSQQHHGAQRPPDVTQRV